MSEAGLGQGEGGQPRSAHPADADPTQGPGGGSLFHRRIPRQLWDDEKSSPGIDPVGEGASERGGQQVGVWRGWAGMGGLQPPPHPSPSLFQLPLPGPRGGQDLLVHGGGRVRHLRARRPGNGGCLGGSPARWWLSPLWLSPAVTPLPGPGVPCQRGPVGVALVPPAPGLLSPRSGVLRGTLPQGAV